MPGRGLEVSRSRGAMAVEPAAMSWAGVTQRALPGMQYQPMAGIGNDSRGM